MDDPRFAAGAHALERFGAFLRRYGHHDEADAVAGVRLVITDREPDAASALADRVEFGGGQGMIFRASPATSPEIVGHELAHAVNRSRTNDWSEETMADLVAVGFARWLSHPSAGDWKIADDIIDPTSPSVHLATRDLANPTLADADAVLRYARAIDTRRVDPHLVGGPLGKAMSDVALRVAPDEWNAIVTNAFVHEVPTARHTAPALPLGTPLEARVLHDLRTAASALIRAAGTVLPHGHAGHGALLDALHAVGLGPGASATAPTAAVEYR